MIEDGIYFGMPEAVYHADAALGSTDLKDILANAVEWHAAERNEAWIAARRAMLTKKEIEREDMVSVGKRFGSALHTIILEPDTFEDRYAVEQATPSHIPRTKQEINDCLVAVGQQPLRTALAMVDYQAACRMHGVMLEDDWRNEQAIENADREVLSPRWHRSLQLIRRALERHSTAGKFLSNGRAEVSVFWTDETGLRLKVRFDYLRIRTVADLKSYAWREGTETVSCFVAAVRKLAYDFSAAHYMDARVNVLPRLVSEGRMFSGDVSEAADVDRHFLAQVAAYDKPRWWWIACKTTGVPEVDAVEMPQDLIQYSAAQTQVEYAKQAYRDMRAKFGDDDDQMWMMDRGLIRLTDFNFSGRDAARGEITWETTDQ